MADVRFVSGVPPVAAFGSDSGTPLVVDIAAGDVYALTVGDVVTKVGRVSSEADLVIAQQAYGRHVMPAPVDVVNANDLLAKRTFNRPAPIVGVVMGDSQSMLQAQVFGLKRLPAMWN